MEINQPTRDAMMNRFDTNQLAPSWRAASEILKGGPGSGAQPGHTFEGNQYGSGGGGGRPPSSGGHTFNGNDHVPSGGGNRPDITSHADAARDLAGMASRVREAEKEGAPQLKGHSDLATAHARLGNQLNSMVRTAQQDPLSQTSQIIKDSIRGAQIAANAHFAAAAAHDAIANGQRPYSFGAKEAQEAQAEALSHVAAMASNNPMGLGSQANRS